MCCLLVNGVTRHWRYQLLKGILTLFVSTVESLTVRLRLCLSSLKNSQQRGFLWSGKNILFYWQYSLIFWSSQGAHSLGNFYSTAQTKTSTRTVLIHMTRVWRKWGLVFDFLSLYSRLSREQLFTRGAFHTSYPSLVQRAKLSFWWLWTLWHHYLNTLSIDWCLRSQMSLAIHRFNSLGIAKSIMDNEKRWSSRVADLTDNSEGR